MVDIQLTTTRRTDKVICLVRIFFVTKEWEMRQFESIVALVQTNAYLLFNYGRVQNGLDVLSKAEFLRGLCKEMIENNLYEKARAERKKGSEKIELQEGEKDRGTWVM